MARIINGIDHIGIASSDMLKNDINYRNMGFNLTQPEPLMSLDSNNKPIELGQYSHHFIFKKTYVELTGVMDSSKDSYIGSFLEKHEGLHILCFNSNNVSNAATKLQQKGINVGKVQISSRRVNYGNKGIAKFKWFIIPHSITPEGLICIVEHLTPELVFQDSLMCHKNFSNSLLEVKICTKNLTQCCENYSKILDTNYVPHPLGYQFDFSSNSLVILNYESYKSQYPSEEPPKTPCLASFSIQVSDIDKTKKFLKDKDINFNSRNSECFWISSKDGGGAIIEFYQKNN